MSLDTIKHIREITGSGIVEVQKALKQADGDETKAIEILRKGGQALAAKRSARATSEGVIGVADTVGKVAFVRLTCETDFVARNDGFIDAANGLAKQALTLSADEMQTLATDKIKNELIIKIGENLQYGGTEVISGEILGFYLHSNRKVAAVVILSAGSADTAREIAMHAAAMKPQYLTPTDVPQEIIAKEQEIYREQLARENKPVEMIEKILPGKLNKYYSDVCLLKQAFVKDDKQTVEQYAASQKAVVKSFKVITL